MLVILPSSESKAPAPARGRPLDIDGLSFPALTAMREQVLDALIETSRGPDALRRLVVGPGFLEEVARNTALRELPTRPVLDTYTGVVHQGLDWATLPPAARRRAGRSVVVASALWGLLRPSDRIPAYRLNICSRLVGLEHLEPAWRTVLPAVLTEAAGRKGAILDLRSGSYQALGRPTALADRTATLQVDQPGGGRRAGSVIAKRTRGLAARHVLETGADPATPEALAEVLGERWPVRIDEPDAPGRPWVLTVEAAG